MPIAPLARLLRWNRERPRRGTRRTDEGDEADPRRYIEAVNAYLVQTKRVVDHLSQFDWEESKDYYAIIFRAAMRRQHEGLEAILHLCEQDRGDAAVPLLRPACEEYIVASYLRRIGHERGQRFIVLSSALDTGGLLAAQETFAGAEVVRDLGFSERFVASAELGARAAREELVVLGEELGWPRSGRSPLPSVRHFAIQTDNLDVYEFLYHATSRFVHFKVNELLRRVWGGPHGMSISSAHFRDHWTTFALYWGMWLHLHTMVEVQEVIERVPDDVLDEGAFFDAIRQLGPKVPLVTAREFLWPGNPPPWE